MPMPPVYLAFYTEDGRKRVAKFRTRQDAKAFVRTGRLSGWLGILSGIPFGPICDTKRGAFNSFDLSQPTGD